MASSGPMTGNNFLVYSAGTAIAYSRTCTISRSVDEVDITSKTSARKYEMLPGRIKTTISVDGLVALDSASNVPYLDGLITAGTKVMVKYSNNTSGDNYWHGYAYCTQLEVSAPENGEMTYSATFVMTSTVTLSDKT